MAPIIHCVRHGQGFHNLGAGCYSLRDPCLTPLGEEQCRALRDISFPDQANISLIAASPLCRTLQSALLTFSPALRSNSSKCSPQILALPDAQETSDDPCDTGSDLSALRGIVAENNWPVDLSLITDGWNVKTLESRYSPHSGAIKARARDARILLCRKIRELVRNGDTDAQIILVTHGGFLHYFTDDWEDSSQYPGTGWHNCETRSYVFEGDFMQDADGDARLTETTESRQRRGKMYPMYGREKQSELFELGMQGWENQGLQRPDKLGTVLDTMMASQRVVVEG
jgi:broad specificity phosphatase PhoE